MPPYTGEACCASIFLKELKRAQFQKVRERVVTDIFETLLCILSLMHVCVYIICMMHIICIICLCITKLQLQLCIMVCMLKN